MKPEERKDQQSTPETPKPSPSSPLTAGPLDYTVLAQEHTAPSTSVSGLEEQGGSGEKTRRLLSAYKETFKVAEDLPAVVWVPWSEKGVFRFLKVPYMRWFLDYFLAHHMHKSLNILNREFHAIAAVNSDHDVNKWDREAIKLYLQSLPPPPYKRLAFAIFFVALLIALPLRSFGDVTHVLDLVGSIMKVDIGGVAKAFSAKEVWETVRAMLVLLLSFSILAFFLTSPFVLKRMLFNLYPANRERLVHTAAREQSFSVKGVYAIEDEVFSEVGLRRPKETPFDLILRILGLLVLLLLSVLLGLMALLAAVAAASTKEVTLELFSTLY